MKKLSASWLLIFTLATTSYAQRLPENQYWLSGGPGVTQFPSFMWASGYEFSGTSTLLILRGLINAELFSDNQPGIRQRELALLYGLKRGKFRFSTGIGYLWGTERGQYLYTDPDPLIYGSRYYERIHYRTVGIPAEIRFIASKKVGGLGLTGFGNWNPKRPFIGVNLSVYVGQMD